MNTGTAYWRFGLLAFWLLRCVLPSGVALAQTPSPTQIDPTPMTTPTPQTTPTPVRTQIWPLPTSTPIIKGSCDPGLEYANMDDYSFEFQWNCGHCFSPARATSTPFVPTPLPTSALCGTPGFPPCTGGVEPTPPPITPTEVITGPHFFLGEMFEVKIVSEAVASGPSGWNGAGTDYDFTTPISTTIVGAVWKLEVISPKNRMGVKYGTHPDAVWHGYNVTGGSTSGTWYNTIHGWYGPNDDFHGNVSIREELINNGYSTIMENAEIRTMGVQSGEFPVGGIPGPILVSQRFEIVGDNRTHGEANFYYWPIYYGENAPEEEPIDPSDIGMCNDGTAYRNPPGEIPGSGSLMPTMWHEPGGCLVVIPEIAWVQNIFDTLGVDPPTFIAQWQGIQYCITYVGVSEMNLFGVLINPINLALASAGIGLLKFALR